MLKSNKVWSGLLGGGGGWLGRDFNLSLQTTLFGWKNLLLYFDLLSLLFSVSFSAVLSKSFRVCKAGNLSSMKGHCTGLE